MLLLIIFQAQTDIGSIKGTKQGSDEEIEMKFDDNAPFPALAFKVANDPFVGSLTLLEFILEL